MNKYLLIAGNNTYKLFTRFLPKDNLRIVTYDNNYLDLGVIERFIENTPQSTVELITTATNFTKEQIDFFNKYNIWVNIRDVFDKADLERVGVFGNQVFNRLGVCATVNKETYPLDFIKYFANSNTNKLFVAEVEEEILQDYEAYKRLNREMTYLACRYMDYIQNKNTMQIKQALFMSGIYTDIKNGIDNIYSENRIVWCPRAKPYKHDELINRNDILINSIYQPLIMLLLEYGENYAEKV